MAQKTKPALKKKIIIFSAVIGVAAIAGIMTMNQSIHPLMHPPVLDTQTVVLHNKAILSSPLPHSPSKPALTLTHLTASPTTFKSSPQQSTAAEMQKQSQSSAITILQNASQGVAMAVSTFSGPDGFVGIIYQSPSPSGGYLRGLAWVLPSSKLILLGDLMNDHGNIVGGAAQFSLHTLRHPLPASPIASARSAALPITSTPSSVSPETGDASSGSAPSIQSGSDMLSNDSSSAYLAAYNNDNSVTEGRSGPLITVFFDPNSESAFVLYKELSTEIHKGVLRVRWVPVAVKGTTSLQRAEYILTAPSPAAALRLNFNSYDVTTHQGGSPLLSNMNMLSQVDQNTAMLSIIGHPDPLVVFYCDAKTSTPLPIYKPTLTFNYIKKLMPNMGFHCN